MMQPSAKGLYVHIPFCKEICHYCDFTKMVYFSSFADSYLKTLSHQCIALNEQSFSSIYVGGGTPTSLSSSQLENLFTQLQGMLKEDYEFTVEANPDSLTEEKIKLFKKYGVNRVSLGVQTFSEKYLKMLGRKHTKEEVYQSIHLLRQYGINNISVDLMYGLPNQSLEELRDDLMQFVSLPVTHISPYSLAIEEHTRFCIEKIESVNDDIMRDFADFIQDVLEEHHFIRYEVSNYSKDDLYHSRHNLIYWTHQEYIGIGSGSHGYHNGKRYSISSSISDYSKGLVEIKEELINEIEAEFEYIMLHLRLVKGINLENYRHRFGFDFLLRYHKPLEKLFTQKLICCENNHLFVPKKDLMILNSIICDLCIDLNY